MERKALITGGAGFIGSKLAEKLLGEGWRVLVLDNLSTGFESNVPKEAEFMRLDLSDKSFVNSLPKKGIDVVLHLAAQSSGEISFEKPAYDVQTNAMGTLLLLQWCKENGVPRFIYTSSMSIYGDDQELPVQETAFPKPMSLYGVGKLASENYVRIYQNMGLETTTLRLFNVYGPGQNMENLKQGMVSIFMAYIAKGEAILVKGSRDRFRDFVFIDDVVDAIMRVADGPLSSGKIYNIGTKKKTYIWQLLDLIVEAFGYKTGEYPITFQGTTPGDQLGIYADISKVSSELGWKPKVELSEGIKRMVTWIRALK
ncbi:NAD-dependent epimerase/dehydratase family protein [Chloroflexota bacterium]